VGQKKNGLIKQFLRDVDWNDLDLLVVDTPPGTTDEHLSLAQYLKPVKDRVSALLISTPQEVAIQDVRRQVSFCRKVGLHIIGIVENMATFKCPKCQKESEVFARDSGGVSKLCEEMEVPYLGDIPLDPRIGYCCDKGMGFVERYPEAKAAKAMREVALKIQQVCAIAVEEA